MATWKDVRRIVLALPEAVEPASNDGLAQWRVRDKLFVWERPLRRSDIQALGRKAPHGPILAARVPHLGAKEALLYSNPKVYFTTPHFDGYPAILVRLDRISVAELEELLVEAWMDRAPEKLAHGYLNFRFGSRQSEDNPGRKPRTRSPRARVTGNRARESD